MKTIKELLDHLLNNYEGVWTKPKGSNVVPLPWKKLLLEYIELTAEDKAILRIAADQKDIITNHLELTIRDKDEEITALKRKIQELEVNIRKLENNYKKPLSPISPFQPQPGWPTYRLGEPPVYAPYDMKVTCNVSGEQGLLPTFKDVGYTKEEWLHPSRPAHKPAKCEASEKVLDELMEGAWKGVYPNKESLLNKYVVIRCKLSEAEEIGARFANKGILVDRVVDGDMVNFIISKDSIDLATQELNLYCISKKTKEKYASAVRDEEANPNANNGENIGVVRGIQV
jgi:hypothetical protein